MHKVSKDKEKRKAEIVEHLKADNRRADRALGHTRELQERLYRELKGRMPEIDATVPVIIGDYKYYRRYEPDRQYEIYCRTGANDDSGEEILIDVNELAGDKPYCDVGTIEVSPDQRILVYAVDFSGREEYTLYFKNLVTGELLPYRITGTSFRVVWSENSRVVFCKMPDKTFRPFKLMRHIVGTSGIFDDPVYEEKNMAYRLNIRKSHSAPIRLRSLR